MKNLNKLFLGLVAVTLFSCNDDFDNPVDKFEVVSGEADFSKYIALGNSLTSGYTNNALYTSAQQNSYPVILAELMKPAGGGEFNIPLMADDIGGFKGMTNFNGKLELKIVGGSLTPQPLAAEKSYENISGQGVFQNVGIPGAKSYHLVAPGYGSAVALSQGRANPYFARILNDASQNKTILQYAAEQKPTFFSLWIGNNDVLGYATSGGVGIDQIGNIDPSTYRDYDISDVNVVKSSINTVLNELVNVNGAKGVIANIPSVTSVPYFTTVPAKPISGLSDAQITQLTTAYSAYNNGLAQAKAASLITEAEYNARLIKFTAGATANGAVMVDKDLTDLSGLGLPNLRQTTSKDLILFTAASLLPTGYGTANPLTDNYVLSEKEVALAEAAVLKFNAAITELASAYNLALVDAYTEMKKLSSSSGIKFYGNTYTTTFVSGGVFSLDGVHLTGTGYAIVANMFVNAINRKYKSNLRQVYPENYPGIKIPN